MRFSARSTAAAISVALCAATLSGCSGSAGNRATDRTTLDIATLSAAQSLDPAEAAGGTVMYFQPVYDTLVERAPDGTYKPMLATRWSYDRARTALSLTLRKGVKFSDRTPFDGEAVRKNLDHFKSGGGANAKTLSTLDKVTVESPTRVTLHLSAPDPAMLFYLSDSAGLMASPAALKGSSLETTPVGTGPYTLDKKKTSLGVKYVYARKADYWGDQLPYKTVTISRFDNETAIVNGLRTRQIDFSVLQEADQQIAVETDPELSGTKVTPNFQGLLLFDRAGLRTPALKNRKVRQALNHALDRRTMLEQIRRGRGESTAQVFGPETKGYDRDLDTRYPHEPATARKLMKEAGYAKGFTLKLPKVAAIVGDNLASSIQSDFKAIGVKVVWDTLDGATAVRKISKDRAYPAMVMNMNQTSTDWLTVQDLVAPGAYNLFGTTDTTIKKLVPRIQRGGDGAAQAARELNRHLVEEAWFVPFYRMEWQQVAHRTVKAAPQSGMGYPSLYNYRPVEGN
ncbi:Heme-binding protein A precursor [Streptomyces sp. YIM 130001]|uniref:ABC transporter substrate-binding protein n=1 Tax=Streptomyces sp. YIM 130001 TaxID=2259644 RepID=UPI000E6573F9|nr:ABC transporter substrate-binding protein [Streptomyces sp. YIM 130001]RII20569.1 Heme-binding protein A precursor [Streptomyces sp. YIM 130001]